MNFFDKIKCVFNASDNKSVSLSDINDMFFGASGSGANGPDISEITYFTCIKTLAESLGKLPVYLMDSDKNRILNHEVMRIFNLQTVLRFSSLLTWNTAGTTMEMCMPISHMIETV